MHDYRTIISTLKTKKHLIHFDNYIGVKNMCMIVMMSYGITNIFYSYKLKIMGITNIFYSYKLKIHTTILSKTTHTHTHTNVCNMKTVYI